MSRTHRFVGGVVLGYAHLVLVTIVGLWMTPFLLARLGPRTLGLWLIAQQLLGYLLLMDVGVNALLPRETAFATGRAGGNIAEASDLPHVVARARQAVRWQLPIVAAVALVTWIAMPARWQPASGPLAVMLASFVVLFPLRLYQAFLQGVQELPFLSRVQIASWTLTTIVTISLVLSGAGLYALVVGWSVGQLSAAGAAWFRVRQSYALAWPAWTSTASWRDVKGYLGQAGWVSVAQVAQVFLSGSDLLLLGAVLGATSVVQYSCTGKLSVVLSNHPQLIMQAATPALSEMRASERRQDLLNVSVALMLAMLTLSGFVACVILALNGSFVHWWVGPDQYGGQRLTLVFTALLILRHFNITLIYGLFCFGQERRISLTNLADGAVGLCAGFFLIRGLGAEGAALGSLAAVMLVSLPANLVALARETGTTVPALTGKLWPWLWRFATIGTVCAGLPFVWAPRGASGMIVVGLAVLATYGIVMTQGLWHGPLGTYARPRLAQFVPVWWRGLPSSARP